MLFAILSALVALLALTFFKLKFQYWKIRKIPYLPPSSQFGNFGIHLKHVYGKIKQNGWKHCGIYVLTNPIYIPVSLDYVKNILTKDFHNFTDRGIYYNEKDDPLTAHLVALEGAKWKGLREKLTPTFSTGKIKLMFPIMVECQNLLLQRMAEELKGGPIFMKEILECFTTDVIGLCAFGLDFNAVQDKDSAFRKNTEKLFIPSKKKTLKRIITQLAPSFAKLIHLKVIPEDVSDFFIKTVEETLEHRKKSLKRNDFIQLLIELQEDGKITVQEIAAQCFVFFLAGFETSATTMNFALYELARNPRVQEKLRQEIVDVLTKSDGKITYENLQEMKYLGQVLDETLRKYPPFTVLVRKCVSDYKIPDENIILEKGTTVFVPVLGIHYDEEFYFESEVFYPERFADKRQSRYSFLPFGEGPRNCIGLRFGLMQSKAGLVSLLKNYKFTVSDMTKEPLVLGSKGPVLTSVEKIWFNVRDVE